MEGDRCYWIVEIFVKVSYITVQIKSETYFELINRPGVARAVLKTPASLNNWLIHWVGHPFVQNLQESWINTLSIPNRKNWGAEILRECLPPTMCHMSHVPCQVSCVRCHVSGVKCLMMLHFWTNDAKRMLKMSREY